MFRRLFLVITLFAAVSFTAVHAENIKAELQYSPMEVHVNCDCNSGKVDLPVYKLGVEGKVYRGVKLGVHYEGTLSNGDGNFEVGKWTELNHTPITDVTYSNFEVFAKLPLDGRKWAQSYEPSERENNFYGMIGYKNVKLEANMHPWGAYPVKRYFEKADGIGFGLGYDGYFSDKFGFNALFNYYPSMNASAPVPMDGSINNWVYRLGLRYDINQTFGVTAGYEGESHYYDNKSGAFYKGIVFGVQGRW